MRINFLTKTYIKSFRLKNSYQPILHKQLYGPSENLSITPPFGFMPPDGRYLFRINKKMKNEQKVSAYSPQK